MSALRRKKELPPFEERNVPSRPFRELLAEVTHTRYAYCRNHFVGAVPEDCYAVPCHRLLEAEIVTALLDRFSTQYRGADKRAIASMWTMHYFSILVIGAAVAILELGRDVPVGLREASLCVCRRSGAPHAFLIKHAGCPMTREHAVDRLHDLLRNHVEPLVEAVTCSSGISRRLIWTNIASYLVWIMGEVSDGVEITDASDALVRAPIWLDGSANPLHNLIRACPGEDGTLCSRRKICCLRYALPGCQGCGASCPIPDGRRPALDSVGDQLAS